MKHSCASTTRLIRLSWVPLLALLAVLPAHAQYKVVGPDGKVTYTDRPPASSTAKVTTLSGRSDAADSGDAALPLDLRQPVAKYPVTLYTVPGSCDPCQSARQMLRQRGIPFAEKLVQSPEDGDALERLSGGRDAPTLAIGSQLLRGLAPEVWSSYLDAAGYPRESRLPPTYQYAAATPLVARRDASGATPAAAASQPNGAAPPPPPNSTGIKF
jgi:glutaredoxin